MARIHYRRAFELLLLLMPTILWSAVGGGDYTDFLAALAARESSNVQTKVNKYGYAGLYQMGEAALVDAGFYKRDGTTSNDWRGSWTGKDGVSSLSDFLHNRQAQVDAVTAYHEKLWTAIEQRGLNAYVGKMINGVVVTESGLLAAAHLVGAGGLRSCLNGSSYCSDANGTTAFSYMSRFGGYNVANITGGSAAVPPNAGHDSFPSNGNQNNGGAPSVSEGLSPLIPSASDSSISPRDAFSAGAGIDYDKLRAAILEILSVTMILWTAWVAAAQYSSWRNGRIDMMVMQTNIIGSAILTMLVLVITIS